MHGQQVSILILSFYSVSLVQKYSSAFFGRTQWPDVRYWVFFDLLFSDPSNKVWGRTCTAFTFIAPIHMSWLEPYDSISKSSQPVSRSLMHKLGLINKCGKERRVHLLGRAPEACISTKEYGQMTEKSPKPNLYMSASGCKFVAPCICVYAFC